jgi:hypothetical protein
MLQEPKVTASCLTIVTEWLQQRCAGEECGSKDGKGDCESLFAIVIAPRTGGGTTITLNAARKLMDR